MYLGQVTWLAWDLASSSRNHCLVDGCHTINGTFSQALPLSYPDQLDSSPFFIWRRTFHLGWPFIHSYLFLVALSLRCYLWAFSSCSDLWLRSLWWLLLLGSAVFSSCGAWAQLLHGMWDLPGTGLKLVSPPLAGGFLVTREVLGWSFWMREKHSHLSLPFTCWFSLSLSETDPMVSSISLLTLKGHDSYWMFRITVSGSLYSEMIRDIKSKFKKKIFFPCCGSCRI